MRATTRFLLLGAFAMCLSACLPEPPMGSEAAIFKRPSRYGWGSSGRRPGPNSSTTMQKKKPQPQSSGNRFGHTENKRKPNSSGPNSPAGGSNNSRTADSGSSSSSTSSGDSGSGSRGEDEDRKEMADSGSSNSGSSNSGGSSSNKKSGSSSSEPPSNLNDYPYANLVPGKKGAVTLPGIGEIDVTGIKPGTPVEIDDPNNPGKKIYFRVP